MARTIRHRYQDPIELIWLRCAADLGMNVERSAQVYAAWDGAGTLTLSTTEDFDPDDSLAQLIFHEICHAFVAGPAGRARPDWGLSNTDDSDLVYEHACHRLQAALSRPFGLRAFMAVTTEWRPYWDALPADPLADDPDPAVLLAREGYRRSQLEPARSVLEAALERTALLAQVVRECAPGDDSLWSTTRARHPAGLLMGSGGNCGSCAWAYGQRVRRCRRSHANASQRCVVKPNWPGCEAYEPSFSEAECQRCAACCREGYDVVELSRDDSVPHTNPTLVQLQGRRRVIPRPDGHCLALQSSGVEAGRFACEIYQQRPRSCRELPVRGDACLLARRRVGITV